MNLLTKGYFVGKESNIPSSERQAQLDYVSSSWTGLQNRAVQVAYCMRVLIRDQVGMSPAPGLPPLSRSCFFKNCLDEYSCYYFFMSFPLKLHGWSGKYRYFKTPEFQTLGNNLKERLSEVLSVL